MIKCANAINQPLETKKYELCSGERHPGPRKVLSFAIPHRLVGSLFSGALHLHISVIKFSCFEFLNTTLDNL
jgi:hypothetical protein